MAKCRRQLAYHMAEVSGYNHMAGMLDCYQFISIVVNVLQDSVRQQDWKIERMARDNRALELQNTELRSQLHEVKTENLEVSEKIVLLDEEVS